MKADTKKQVVGFVVVVAGVMLALVLDTAFRITSKIPKVG